MWAFDTPTDEPMLAGLTKAGQPEVVGELRRQPGRQLVLAEAAEPGLRDPGGQRDLLGHRLVHADRRAEHAAADVRHAGQFEHPLHRAVLAERAVEQRQDDGPSGGAGGVG